MSHHLSPVASFLALITLTILTTSCGEFLVLATICVALCVSAHEPAEPPVYDPIYQLEPPPNHCVFSVEPDSISDWLISHHISTDNRKTGESLVVNKVSFKGQFSGWVNYGSEMRADIKVSSEEDVKIYLYELGKTDFAEELSYEEYFLKVRSSENEQWEGQVRCHEGCELSEELSRAVHQQLKTGENLKFSFYTEEYKELSGSSDFEFCTGHHEGYSEAFDKL